MIALHDANCYQFQVHLEVEEVDVPQFQVSNVEPSRSSNVTQFHASNVEL